MNHWLTKFLQIAGICLLSGAHAEESAENGQLKLSGIATAFKSLLEEQGIQAKFAAHQDFASKLFADSAGEKSFKDKTGNCRLRIVGHLVTNPEHALNLVEMGTRRAMEAAQTPGSFYEIINLMGAVADGGTEDKIDEEQLERGMSRIGTLSAYLEEIGQGNSAQSLKFAAEKLAAASEEFQVACKGLSAEEMKELRAELFSQTTGNLTLGHRFADQEKGRRVTDLLEKINRSALARCGIDLGAFQEELLLAALAKTPRSEEKIELAGAKGTLYQEFETPHGIILVGGPEANEYQLDEMMDVAMVIDLGGNDIYHEGTTTEKRPILAVIDLAGDDSYQGKKPGIHGSGILGASILVDVAGNDKYQGVDVAQGSALGGVGILVDKAGNDTYVGDRRVQGQATGGLGILLDKAGDDKYRAALLSQGVGGPLGCGTLIDLDGADHYFAGGKYPGGYDDTPGFGSWSQGVGVGPRGVANGGIGIILDGGGDDIYEADYFSHGGGYWFAAGVARDFGGNDQRLGATRENFDGTERTEPRFVRWGTGYGCHYAAGFVIDDEGNDTYQADFAVIAYAWDFAVAGICDLAGDDKYITGGSGVCEAHNAAVSFLYDKSGNDEYQGGIASTKEETLYHPEGGSGNYTFLLDEAGEDKYGRDLKNGQTQERGWAGAILIDR